MQHTAQLHTEHSTNLSLEAVQRYVDSLAGRMEAPVMRSGSFFGGSSVALGVEVLDLDTKNKHVLESDIVSTRIYPHRHEQTVSLTKVLPDANAIRSLYEATLERLTGGAVWTIASSYQVFIYLDAAAEHVLRSIESGSKAVLGFMRNELSKATHIPVEVPVNIDNAPLTHRHATATNVVEVFEQPHRIIALDTLVFALEEEESDISMRTEEGSMRAETPAADIELHDVFEDDDKETSQNMAVCEQDKATFQSVIKDLYLQLRYGPPHLR